MNALLTVCISSIAIVICYPKRFNKGDTNYQSLDAYWQISGISKGKNTSLGRILHIA